ncbi:MAG: substrate-binding domain-containing protein [Verrucomicrobiota bacterium]
MNASSPTALQLPQRHSLVSETARSLRENIEAGHWLEHLPGEREMCELLQVSRRTLRAALDELQRIGMLEVQGRQRRRITNQVPMEEVMPTKRVIGILTPGSFLSMPPPIAFMMDTLRAKLTAAGYEVRLHAAPGCYTATPARGLKQFIATHPASAWLVLSAEEAMQRWLVSQKLPCLILGSAVPGITTLPSVDADFHATSRHAGTLLWRKGHRRIALVLPDSHLGGDLASEAGLREALEQVGGAKMSMLHHDGSAAGVCRVIDDSLKSTNPPTAYIVGRSAHVLTVLMHLMRRGKRIPQDVAVLARDSDPILECTSPKVSRYASEPKQFAARLITALRQLADHGSLSTPTVRLMPTYVAGETI